MFLVFTLNQNITGLSSILISLYKIFAIFHRRIVFIELGLEYHY